MEPDSSRELSGRVVTERRSPPFSTSAQVVASCSRDVMVCEESVGVEMPKGAAAAELGAAGAGPPAELRRRVWPQHTAALLATLLAMSGGIVMGWSTPAVPYLQTPMPLGDGSNATTLPITDEEGSWLGSLSAIGALVGAAPAGFLSDLVGRKRMLLLFSIPLIASWVMIILVDRNIVLLYVARFISGIGLGGATALSPVYNEEIAEVKIRGALGTYCEVMICVGIFYAFCVGSYLDYLWYQAACAAVPVVFLLSFAWMPESPVYLVLRRRDAEAERSLRWLRGAGAGEDRLIKAEMEGMRRFVEQARRSKTSTGDQGSCVNSPTFKAACIVFGLMSLQQMCGTCAIMYYTVNVFRDAGSTLSPYVCSIIVAFVQLVFGVVTTRVVDHLGRRPMLMFSTLCLAACLLVMAAYTQVKQSGVDVSAHTWVPLLALNIFVVGFEFGVGPLPWLMMAELAPSNSRGFISGASVCYNWFLVFLVTKCFTNMIDAMGLAMTYGCYAIFMFLGFFFAWLCVPETNGKTREEIQAALKYGSKQASNAASCQQIVLLYVARFISGIALGGSTVISPVYNEEIADVDIRGALGTYCEIQLCVGIFYAYCVGSYLDYLWFQVASCAVPVLFLVTFAWMPESPVFLVMKGRDGQAEKALAWLKGSSRHDAAVQGELEAIRVFVGAGQRPGAAAKKTGLDQRLRKVLTGISESSPTFRATYVVFGLMVMQQMCGTCAIMYYMVNVFRDAGSTLSPYVCSIIVAFVQLTSGFVASRVVDHLGRRPMLLFSSTSLAVCLAVLAAYTHFRHAGVDLSSYTWVPLVALNLFVVTFEFGVGPLPWLMMAELAPSKSRGFISGASVCFNWLLVFVVTKCFTNMIDGIGLAMTYGCYGIFMCAGFVFVWFFVPETKGKTRETIQHELKYGQKSVP
ncbi:facilitated trehalose transporter Tret1-like [Bacillus rossius redtenbacheri]|uniref:facilitated trehalose transporter Tret1-like n=1 Tax=Bacillus rossius redtenbacheri TaxID=93214 RepID=UPI002FDEFD7A